MKKICFIAPKSYPLFNPKVKKTFGGSEVQLYLLAKEFARNKDLDIHFIVANYRQNELEEYDGIKVWKSFDFSYNILKRIISFLKISNKINAEIYIQRALTPFSGLLALYYKLRKKKFIYMVANDGEVDGTHCLYKNRSYGFLAKLVFKYSSLIVSQNKYQRKTLLKNKINNVLIKSSYPITNNTKIKKGKYILWVGRADKLKQPKLFLRLANCFPEKKFIMICPPSTTDTNLFNDVQKEAAKIKNLKFIKFVPFSRINKYFQEAKIFVNTSSQEGFPNTFVQATKNKTPIISLNVNPDNFLVKYRCGFFCKNDFNKMNKKLKELLKNTRLYVKMSENAFKYAKKNHDIKKNSLEFFKNCISNPQKILHIISSSGSGGAENLVKNIVRLERNSYVYALRKDKIDCLKELNKKYFYFDTYKPYKFNIKILYDLYSIIKNYRFNILHVHLEKPLIYAILLKILLPKILIVYHEHGMIIPEYQTSKGPFVYIFLIKISRRFINKYIVLSDYIKKIYLKKIKINKKKIVKLPNSIDLKKFNVQNKKKFNVEINKKNLKINKDDFVIGFVGSLRKVKGCEYLIKSLPYLNFKYKVLVAGNGPLLKDLKKLAKEKGLKDKVFFMGFVSNMPKFYFLLDVLVIPSTRESFSLALIEAQSSGIPVIVSDVPSMRENILDEQKSILFKPKDPIDLSNKIIKIKQNILLREKIIREGLKNKERFGLQAYLKKLKGIYKEIK